MTSKSNYTFTPVEQLPDIKTFTFVEEYGHIASRLASDDYVYDPRHKNMPKGGMWRKTDRGWSRADGKGEVYPTHDVEMTFSPEVNVGGPKREKTTKNYKKMRHYVEYALKQELGRSVEFKISEQKAGRYLEKDRKTGMDVLYKEASFNIKVNDLTEDEANKVAKRLAHGRLMFQSSILVWNEKERKARLVHRNIKPFQGADFDFDDHSIKLFVEDSGNQRDDIGKIDTVIKESMRGKTTGWTIAPSRVGEEVNISGKNYIRASRSIVMHGVKDEDAENIGKGLAKRFGKDVWMVDLKEKKERLIRA
jgi:hypothetical protein